jgi:hypothetical protein
MNVAGLDRDVCRQWMLRCKDEPGHLYTKPRLAWLNNDKIGTAQLGSYQHPDIQQVAGTTMSEWPYGERPKP